ncbi:MAG: hypothetical protein D6714_16020 [Bacteroidetes bacterium]|nr:MAG: hypothetical protein D6714_16020 [Bacteroidota bacterium]
MKLSAIVRITDPEACLVKIYGLTILERTLRALERAGVGMAVLVTDSPEPIRKRLQKEDPFTLKIAFEKDSASALATISGPYFWIAEPLVIEPNLLKEMGEESREKGAPVGTTDARVFFFGEKIQSLPIESFEKQPGATLKKAGISFIEKKTEGRVYGVVRDKDSRRQIEKMLIRSLTKPTDGWVSRHLNRPISTTISRVLAHTPITPNQFTILTGFIGLATGFFLARGGYWNYLIGGALFHLTSVLDGVDGELARLKFKSSPFGQWLDTLVDNLSYLAGLGGIVYGVYVHGAPEFVRLSGLLAVVFAVLALGSLYFYLLRFKAGGTLLNVQYSFQNGTSTFDKIMRGAALFGKRDLFALIFFILGIFGLMPFALTYVAIMAFFILAFSIQAHLKGAPQQAQ